MDKFTTPQGVQQVGRTTLGFSEAAQEDQVQILMMRVYQELMNQYQTLSQKEAHWIVEKRMFAEVGLFQRNLKAAQSNTFGQSGTK